MNNITKKIDAMRAERGWSVYKLAQESGLPAPTIRKWFQSDMFPSVPALKQICGAFNITLADLFAENNLIEATPEIKKLYDSWCSLTQSEQAAVEAIVKSYTDKKSHS